MSNHFNNTIDPISDFQAAVVVTTKEYMEAWGRKDSHGVANCYAEDGIFLVPGRDVLRGTFIPNISHTAKIIGGLVNTNPATTCKDLSVNLISLIVKINC